MGAAWRRAPHWHRPSARHLADCYGKGDGYMRRVAWDSRAAAFAVVAIAP